MNTNTTTTTKRWLAGFVMAAGLGTAIVTGTAAASADIGTATNTNTSTPSASDTMGPVNDGVSGRKLQEQIGVKKFIRITLPTETITAKPPQPK